MILKSMKGEPAPGEEKEEEGEEMGEMEACCAEFILAVEKKDPEMLMKAFHACFAICDAMPHEEGDKRDMEKPLIGGYIDESEL